MHSPCNIVVWLLDDCLFQQAFHNYQKLQKATLIKYYGLDHYLVFKDTICVYSSK